jgi:hypothetical protein
VIILLKKLYLILYIAVILFSNGCAWENLPPGGEKTQKIVTVTMQLGGAMDPRLFYYIVFNLSQKADKLPFSVFTGVDRAKNWSVYYMYGQPPNNKTLDLYRGYGGVNKKGENLVDRPPTRREYLNELKSGTVVEGDHMTLVIDLTPFNLSSTSTYKLSMNMMVCNQPIDSDSQSYYDYAPYVFDSFFANGITMVINSTTDYWYEGSAYGQEPPYQPPNEHEDVAPANANIINWNFQIVSR